MSNGRHDSRVSKFLPLLEVPRTSSKSRNGITAPDQRRTSQDTTWSGSHAQSLGFSESSAQSQLAVPKTPTGFESGDDAVIWHEQSPMHSPSYDATTGFTCQTSRSDEPPGRCAQLLDAQREWMELASEIMDPAGEVRMSIEHHQSFVRMAETWKDIQVLAHRVQSPGRQPNIPDAATLPQRASHNLSPGPPTSQEAISFETPHSMPYPNIVIDEPEEIPGTHTIDYADLYYEHASAVNYLSEELINLGPRPITKQSWQSHETSYEQQSDGMTPYEYAERHIQLLKELSFARAEAAKYQGLCRQHNIPLEEVSSYGDEDQSEGTYQAALLELEYGAARVESLVTLNQTQQETFEDISMAKTDAPESSRIMEWATSVASQTEGGIQQHALSPQWETKSDLGVDRTPQQLPETDHACSLPTTASAAERRHARSKSTSAILPVRPVTRSRPSHHRASSPCLTRSDSGFGFAITA